MTRPFTLCGAKFGPSHKGTGFVKMRGLTPITVQRLKAEIQQSAASK